jgi:hypothetical protein
VWTHASPAVSVSIHNDYTNSVKPWWMKRKEQKSKGLLALSNRTAASSDLRIGRPGRMEHGGVCYSNADKTSCATGAIPGVNNNLEKLRPQLVIASIQYSGLSTRKSLRAFEEPFARDTTRACDRKFLTPISRFNDSFHSTTLINIRANDLKEARVFNSSPGAGSKLSESSNVPISSDIAQKSTVSTPIDSDAADTQSSLDTVSRALPLTTKVSDLTARKFRVTFRPSALRKLARPDAPVNSSLYAPFVTGEKTAVDTNPFKQSLNKLGRSDQESLFPNNYHGAIVKPTSDNINVTHAQTMNRTPSLWSEDAELAHYQACTSINQQLPTCFAQDRLPTRETNTEPLHDNSQNNDVVSLQQTSSPYLNYLQSISPTISNAVKAPKQNYLPRADEWKRVGASLSAARLLTGMPAASAATTFSATEPNEQTYARTVLSTVEQNKEESGDLTADKQVHDESKLNFGRWGLSADEELAHFQCSGVAFAAAQSRNQKIEVLLQDKSSAKVNATDRRSDIGQMPLPSYAVGILVNTEGGAPSVIGDQSQAYNARFLSDRNAETRALLLDSYLGVVDKNPTAKTKNAEATTDAKPTTSTSSHMFGIKSITPLSPSHSSATRELLSDFDEKATPFGSKNMFTENEGSNQRAKPQRTSDQSGTLFSEQSFTPSSLADTYLGVSVSRLDFKTPKTIIGSLDHMQIELQKLEADRLAALEVEAQPARPNKDAGSSEVEVLSMPNKADSRETVEQKRRAAIEYTAKLEARIASLERKQAFQRTAAADPQRQLMLPDNNPWTRPILPSHKPTEHHTLAFAVPLAKLWKTPNPLLIQGGALQTLSFASPMVECVHVLLKTDGRPLDADVSLWYGPDNTPQKIRVYSEDGLVRPFSVFLETPNCDNTVALRNKGGLEFPMTAKVISYGGSLLASKYISDNAIGKNIPRIIQGGGAIRTYPFDLSVHSVRILLKTDGCPLNARVELIQGPATNKQIVELYTEDGMVRPFTAVMETPGSGCVVRICNTGPMEFPLTASIVPHVVDMGRSSLAPIIGGDQSGDVDQW